MLREEKYSTQNEKRGKEKNGNCTTVHSSENTNNEQIIKEQNDISPVSLDSKDKIIHH